MAAVLDGDIAQARTCAVDRKLQNHHDTITNGFIARRHILTTMMANSLRESLSHVQIGYEKGCVESYLLLHDIKAVTTYRSFCVWAWRGDFGKAFPKTRREDLAVLAYRGVGGWVGGCVGGWVGGRVGGWVCVCVCGGLHKCSDDEVSLCRKIVS